MPIKNTATLLENIVLVEAARLLFDSTDSDRPIEFLNAFAMPPLSPWQGEDGDRGFSQPHLDSLKHNEDDESLSLHMRLLRDCFRHAPSEGPSGALLVGLLSCRAGRRLRMWVNDLPDEDPNQQRHYGNAISGLRNLDALIQTLCPNHTHPPSLQVCDIAYPDSLENLGRTLANWSEVGPPSVRLGYLDPMNYSVKRNEFNQTSSEDHKLWLRLLDSGTDGPVVSVHFTGNPRGPEALSHELHSLFMDGEGRRMEVIEFRHANYAVVAHVKRVSPSQREFIELLEEAVQDSWRSWFKAIGTGVAPSSLFSTRRRKVFGCCREMRSEEVRPPFSRCLTQGIGPFVPLPALHHVGDSLTPFTIALNAALGVEYLPLPLPPMADSRTSLSRGPRSKGDSSPPDSRNFAWTTSSFIEEVTARLDVPANSIGPVEGRTCRS